MGDQHDQMIHAAAPTMHNSTSTSSSSGTLTSHGDWWNTATPAVSCSPEMTVFSGWSTVSAASHDHVRSNNTASSESPVGSTSLNNGSPLTYQEPTAITDPGIAVPPPSMACFAGWNQPFLYMSSRSDQDHISTSSLMNTSSNNLIMLQDHHDQNHQFLSDLGSELLSSPTLPYGLHSSLLRSITEPTAATAAARPLPGFQQYQHQQMNQAPSSIREPPQFWSPSAGFGAAADEANLGAARPPSAAPRPANLAAKTAIEGVGDSSSIIRKKANANADPAFKKPRIETPSTSPTFKVRKEKLGDRVTALQQLVSPFGKTDTASVLHETIEYIKFLHDQVGGLSAPYLKNGHQVPHLKSKDGGEATLAKRDLVGRGLCLVPISSTFAVAGEAPVDFWNPFGATFR